MLTCRGELDAGVLDLLYGGKQFSYVSYELIGTPSAEDGLPGDLHKRPEELGGDLAGEEVRQGHSFLATLPCRRTLVVNGSLCLVPCFLSLVGCVTLLFIIS